MPVRVPYPDRSGPFAGLSYVDANPDIDELYGVAGFSLKDLFAEALAAGALDANQMVRDFALALEQTVRASRNQLANLHHQVGVQAQQHILAAYEEARVSRGRNDAPYRESTRDAGGRLFNALAAPEFFRGTYDGIGMANRNHLDREARQWHRLNFGARSETGGGGPGSRPTATPLTWQGLVVGSLGLPFEPSPGFGLPWGYWTEGNAFRPTGPRQIFPTAGVRAWNFLDAGTATIAREIGPAYEGLYGRWLESAQRGVGPLSRIVDVRAA
jgi:hypothetical protein